MEEIFSGLAFLFALAAAAGVGLVYRQLRRTQDASQKIDGLQRYIGDEFLRARQEQNQQQALQRGEIAREMETLRVRNNEKLEQMRKTVDERLTKTLNERLSESFRSVSTHLEQVQRGLGEMQSLATDVGGLKKALTNVKIRGTFGEVQLERILDQMLGPGQYEKNAAIKAGSQERVEFALRLPGQTPGETVLLPMDSKFPAEDYERLLLGYDAGDKALIDEARKGLFAKLRLFAKGIHEKYIDVPRTTDFAVLFLPTEGLYAEVAQNAAFFEGLHQDWKVTITGPTTLSAFLNALQMGFKTLAIERRSVEVWKVLGAVKTEFETFSLALQSAQEKIRKADSELDNLVGTRTTAMKRKLREVEHLPATETAALLE
ncbi:MAG: DNA recombination protein RmuC [Oscillospiraceae bacterium]|jgi:DNA recombination protein RmuC|nr:DNA recombination protein RmuC [Oscillospiraceae bacterium]